MLPRAGHNRPHNLYVQAIGGKMVVRFGGGMILFAVPRAGASPSSVRQAGLTFWDGLATSARIYNR